ncbi:MAG: ABC transporter ATP-binding protein, partial [Lentisphaeria bacterium]|nr:ABC transporter ATP-binding protein [Lentisphaeria bacterium]
MQNKLKNIISNLIITLADLLSKGATLAGLVVILISLGPVLLIALLIGVVLMLLIYARVSKYQTEVMQEVIPNNRRFSYYFNLGFDKEVQKDIRLYQMQPMVTERVVEFSNNTCDMFEKMQKKMGNAMGQMAAVGEGIAAFSYGYVGLRTLGTTFGPQLSLGALIMYVSAAINFSSIVTAFGQSMVMLLQFLSWLDPYMEFMS